MNIRHMEIFINVVRYGNFSNASKKLSITQPAISSSMDLLEKELQTKLFYHQGRKIQLTQAGEEFYRGALSILRLTEETINKVTQKNTVSGDIRIATTYIPSVYFLPPYINRFNQQHHNIHFDISVCPSNEVIKEVLLGNYDIGITGAPIKQDNIIQQCVFTDHMQIVAPATAFFQALPKTLTLEQLKTLPYIHRGSDANTPSLAEFYLREHSLSESHLNIVATTNHIETAIQLVLQGVGIAIVPSCFIDKYPQLLVLQVEKIDFWRNFYLIYLNNIYLPSSVKSFIQTIPTGVPSDKNMMGAKNWEPQDQ